MNKFTGGLAIVSALASSLVSSPLKADDIISVRCQVLVQGCMALRNWSDDLECPNVFTRGGLRILKTNGNIVFDDLNISVQSCTSSERSIEGRHNGLFGGSRY